VPATTEALYKRSIPVVRYKAHTEDEHINKEEVRAL
jgi:hypothetical protein